MTQIDRRVTFDSGYAVWVSPHSSDHLSIDIEVMEDNVKLYLSLDDARALADALWDTAIDVKPED